LSKKLLLGVLEANRYEHYDREIIRELVQLGLLGDTLSDKFGGSEVNYVNYVSYGFISRKVEPLDSGKCSAISVKCLLFKTVKSQVASS
jgi:glutaryl-CoA dehydrogenase